MIRQVARTLSPRGWGLVLLSAMTAAGVILILRG
jgi:hypothetical protein